MAEDQWWREGVSHFGLVLFSCETSGPSEMAVSMWGLNFGLMLNSTWVSSHTRTPSESKCQSPSSTGTMALNPFWMKPVLTCYDGYLSRRQLLTLLILHSFSYNLRKCCGLNLYSLRAEGMWKRGTSSTYF